METLTPLAAVVLLFLAVGIGFIFVHLLAGKFIRPNKPDPEKKTVYECGEPTIGSAWIQFDLRFYVVALLFVIFDVEVAFFFPWAVVFGKAQAVASAPEPKTDGERAAYGAKVNELIPQTPEYLELRKHYANLGNVPNLPEPDRKVEENRRINQYKGNAETARQLVWVSLAEIVVFFGVLLVGFAYLWRRGDLEWVRSTLAERPAAPPKPSPPGTNGSPLIGAPAPGTLVEAGS
jgi:NADH-quinone oxidoreductase subunit A